MPGVNFEDLNNQIKQDFADIPDSEALEALRIKYLGRKGILAELTASISSLPAEQKPEFGQRINRIKQQINALLQQARQGLEGASGAAASLRQKLKQLDITAPGISQPLGHRHLIAQVSQEICDIFVRLGFIIAEGPEIETEYNNFTALNIPLEHPSRDGFDTFYVQAMSDIGKHEHRESSGEDRCLLRSHTSPVQIRAMKSRKPPLAIIVPGRVYRPDAVDASHSFMFHQVEGFMVDENIGFSDLKGVLELFARRVFGASIKMRFRPHFFPFTEPSAEVDISCILCRRSLKRNCPVCHGKGWLEILGSGMIHPNVFKHVGYDADKYTGFAFGMGVERIAMLKYGINDIRLFFENDLRFLRQF